MDLAGIVTGDLLVFVTYPLDDRSGSHLVEELDETGPAEVVPFGASRLAGRHGFRRDGDDPPLAGAPVGT